MNEKEVTIFLKSFNDIIYDILILLIIYIKLTH